MATIPEEIRRAGLVALRNNADTLERELTACQCVAEDNWSDWWDPLTAMPVEKICPTALATNAKEGAARAEAARILLDKALLTAISMSKALHRLEP